MKILYIFVVSITWLSCQGFYFILRTKALYKAYKSSGKKSFLDYFEYDYLGLENSTWRRRYNFIYNTRLYKIGCYIIGIVSLLIALGMFILLLYVGTSDFRGLLKETL